jgi:glutathione synthase/RimK-type ligase-like ATP-grasp enzyme
MILVVTQQADVSADLVVERLGSLRLPFARLNCEQALASVSLSTFEPEGAAWLVDEAGSRIDLRSIRAIWYRMPALPIAPGGLAPEHARFAQREAWAHVLGTLMSLDVHWISDPGAIWRANQKALQLVEARRIGLRIPRTCITRSPAEARSFIASVQGHVIAKPVTYGNVEQANGEQAIYTTRLPLDVQSVNLESLRYAPVILQEEVPKLRDVRVTVVGDEVFAVGIESQGREETVTDWRRPTTAPLEHVPIDLPPTLREALRGLVRRLGLDFGAIDVVETPRGEFFFLEINPNGQWGWLQLRTGLDIAGSIASRLAERLAR